MQLVLFFNSYYYSFENSMYSFYETPMLTVGIFSGAENPEPNKNEMCFVIVRLLH